MNGVSARTRAAATAEGGRGEKHCSGSPCAGHDSGIGHEAGQQGRVDCIGDPGDEAGGLLREGQHTGEGVREPSITQSTETCFKVVDCVLVTVVTPGRWRMTP